MPVMERMSFYLNGEYSTFEASMSEWLNFETYFNGDLATLLPHTDLDWRSVNEMSDVDVTRFVLGTGLRYRSEAGFGYELNWTMADYDDDAPYLEDETGSLKRLTMLVSKSF